MIACRRRMNDVSKSNPSRLIEYLMDTQGVSCRVGKVRVTNCEADDPHWAAIEMRAVQNQNTRAVGEKTYHLVLSFHEYPTEKVAREIEQQFCSALGYQAHQRVSVMHDDTDNPHIHIVINKIHPEKLTMHEPYYDHQKLAALCGQMERLYGLKADNHIPHAQATETRAKAMEQAGDLESLIGKIQRSCLEGLKKTESWRELHAVLGEHGFSMRIRANGLIISSGDIHVKASSVDRSLSKKRLEDRLGPFDAACETPKRSEYEVKPMEREHFDTSALWKQYAEWVDENDRQRKSALRGIRRERDAELEKVRTVSNLRATVIRHFVSGMAMKRVLYSLNKQRLRKKAAAAKAAYTQRRAAVHQGYPHATWNGWLRRQAAQGNTVALAALRARKSAADARNDDPMSNVFWTAAQTISAADARTAKPPNKPPVKVTNQGTYIFAEGSKLTARQVRLAPDASDSTVREGLETAAYCFGSRLNVAGSKEFRTRVARLAAQHNMSVSFEDAAMEKQRRNLIIAGVNKNRSQRNQGRGR